MQTMRTAGRIVPITLILAVLPAPTFADEQPAAEAVRSARQASLAQRVSQLVGELDSDSRETRTQAQVELLRLGPQALPHLPPPELLPNSAVRAIVRGLRLALEEQQARESVQPSRITLAGELPLQEVLQEFREQSGNGLEASALARDLLKKRVRVEFRETPFWSALDTLAEQAEVTWNLNAGGETLRLEPRTAASKRSELAVDGSGVYRVAITSAGLRPIAGRPNERLLRFTGRFTAEPRLRPLFFAYAGDDLQVTAGGRTLAPFSPDAKKEIPFGEGGKDVRVTWDFVVPADTEVAEASLTAKATVLTAAGREPITFAELGSAEGAARRRGGVTVRVDDVLFRASEEDQPETRQPRRAAADGKNAAEPGGRTARVRVAVSYDTGGPAFESHRTWIFHNQAYLETKDGRRIAYDGLTTDLARDGAVAVEYQFDHVAGAAGDYRFVYVAPTLLINVPVEVKLTGIPVSTVSALRRNQRGNLP